VLQTYHHHGVVLLDREHVRILSVYLGTLLDEIEVHGSRIPRRTTCRRGVLPASGSSGGSWRR
jgi:hypothetical protein